jgi:multicomponent Na+:H+ antiporter subunit E
MGGFFCLWLVLAGADSSDLPVGVATAFAAAGISLALLPPGSHRIRPMALAHLIARFLLQSILAGFDVARRAFDPRLPLRPGLLTFSTRLGPGPARSLFCMMESLLPGTLPAGSEKEGTLLLHCLDIDQPVQAQMALDETLFLDALGEGDRHG